MVALPGQADLLSSALLAHYDRHGRKLPWRQTNDPYAIWLSEVMLQQTGVMTVTPYYHRFLARFPTVQHLAAAELAEVLGLWQGLGYYQRARNLHRAAQVVCQDLAGILPINLAGWRTLPGVGANTAAAVMAIAHGATEAILDGNVKRVLSRLLATANPPTTTLWQVARLLTPTQRPGDYAQAIMDLGATLCLPKAPLCFECPWQAWCQGKALGSPTDFPLAPVKPHRPRLMQGTALIQRDDGQLMLVRRPEKGLLGGLWEPLASPATPTAPPSIDDVVRNFGITARPGITLPPIRHTFTHFHLTLTPHLFHYSSGEPCLTNHLAWCWADKATCTTLPMATLHRKVLATLPKDYWKDW